jgi:hypothetical protein
MKARRMRNWLARRPGPSPDLPGNETALVDLAVVLAILYAVAYGQPIVATLLAAALAARSARWAV